MSDKKSRAASREGRAREIEESQKALRSSISEAQRLVDKSDEMLLRHRREQDEEDGEPGR